MGPAAAQLVACGRQLRKLSLFNSRLGDEGAFKVAELAASEALTALLELELSACSIGATGMQSLFGALQTGVAPALEVMLLLVPGAGSAGRRSCRGAGGAAGLQPGCQPPPLQPSLLRGRPWSLWMADPGMLCCSAAVPAAAHRWTCVSWQVHSCRASWLHPPPPAGQTGFAMHAHPTRDNCVCLGGPTHASAAMTVTGMGVPGVG